MSSGEDRFREMFYEEARELLIGLEEGLMELERRRGDRAHLDQTFRSAHSLKGAAAMVGLAAIAEFTHHIEAVLDQIRSGVMGVDAEIITSLLEARDHLAAMVEAEAAHSPIPPSTELVGRLAGLIGGGSAKARAREAIPPAAAPAPPKPEPKSRSRKLDAKPSATAAPTPAKRKKKSSTSETPVVPALTRYQISLRPGHDVLKRGINLAGIFDELRELGQTTLTADVDSVPPLERIDPEQSYLVWTITIATDAAPERIDEVFLFLAEDSEITIGRIEADGRLVPIGSAPRVEASAAEPRPRRAPRPSSAVVPAVEPTALPPAAAQPHANGAPEHAPARPSHPTLARPHARIRVDAGQLDELVGLAGELVVVTDNLMGLREMGGMDPWSHALEALERVSRQIRDTTLELRMVPVDELFSRFPRVVRDLSDRSGKEIDLRIIGQDTRLDRTIVERLGDPMVHLIRNAVDHALELPAERQAKGKPRAGRITLSAGHEGDRVAIRVEDDGRGLDREKIVKKGIALGMVPTGTSPDDPRVVSLIFEPGFSTRDSVSDMSGRGVGLDVVRDAVRALRGGVAVESVPGKGTAFVFRLPLTLALIDGLLVETAGGRFVVPLAQVEECVSLAGVRSALAEGRPCVAVRGELVPMVSLRNLFRADGPPPARQELLLTRHAGQRVGVAVDRLLGRVQAVIQSLGEGLHGLGRFSGATILGDGAVSLILDLSAVVSESRFAETATRSPYTASPWAESQR